MGHSLHCKKTTIVSCTHPMEWVVFGGKQRGIRTSSEWKQFTVSQSTPLLITQDYPFRQHYSQVFILQVVHRRDGKKHRPCLIKKSRTKLQEDDDRPMPASDLEWILLTGSKQWGIRHSSEWKQCTVISRSTSFITQDILIHYTRFTTTCSDIIILMLSLRRS
jgi:hypothetical protein